MKVLWFCNTPANAEEYYNPGSSFGGGWLKALDRLLQVHVDLHIAFSANHSGAFKYKGTTYHPIKTEQNLLSRALKRFLNYEAEHKDLIKYFEIINSVKPDIIHIHGTENAFSNIIPHIKIPVVVSIQGIITPYVHKYCSGFEKRFLHVKNRNVKGLKDFFFPWSFYVQYSYFQVLQKQEVKNLNLVRNIIGRTSWDKRVTQILAPGSVYFHGDEVLHDLFYQNKWSPHSGNRIIIHTTNGNNFYKGFETLCAALNELNNAGVECEWRVAGIAPDDFIVRITKEKLKIDYPKKGLILTGNLNEESLIRKLLQADIYVLTSHIENSPNSLCEAMMLGMPCISTFAGGVGSLMKDGKEGLLIQDGDPWALAGAVLEMASDREKAIQLGRSARKAALKRHDRKRIISELVETYSNIINHRSHVVI